MADRVLVIDDIEAVRDAVSLLLEFEGFEVYQARDGIESVTQALRYKPGVIVLDHRMPDYDGGKTASVLKALVPDARILAFSAVLN